MDDVLTHEIPEGDALPDGVYRVRIVREEPTTAFQVIGGPLDGQLFECGAAVWQLVRGTDYVLTRASDSAHFELLDESRT